VQPDVNGLPAGLAAMIGFDKNKGEIISSAIPSCLSCQEGHAGPSNHQSIPEKQGLRCRVRRIEIVRPGVFGLYDYGPSIGQAKCELDGAIVRLDPIPTDQLWREWASGGFEKCRKQAWDCVLEMNSCGRKRTVEYRGQDLDGDDDLYGEEGENIGERSGLVDLGAGGVRADGEAVDCEGDVGVEVDEVEEEDMDVSSHRMSSCADIPRSIAKRVALLAIILPGLDWTLQISHSRSQWVIRCARTTKLIFRPPSLYLSSRPSLLLHNGYRRDPSTVG
jgi:hypothetical protein